MLNLDYDEIYNLSISHPEKIWHEMAQEVIWDEPYTHVLEDKQSPIPKWFVGGKINMSFNCLDKHVNDGYGNEVAIIHETPHSEKFIKITYKELLDEVELLAGVLVDKCKIKIGDRVLMYFPVIPQCLIAMLACTRIGATYTIVYGGFSYGAIAGRINHIEPKLILTCNVAYDKKELINYKENIDKAIEISNCIPQNCIIYNRPNTVTASFIKDRDLDWEYEIKRARPHGPVSLESNHIMLVIYTSGSTGEPKGLVAGTGNLVVSDKYCMKYQLGLKSNDICWGIGDFGWLTGQVFMSYGLLLNRCTTLLYEGYPFDDIIPKLIQRHNVTNFLSSPTVMRHLRYYFSDLVFPIKFDKLEAIFVGGELLDLNLKNWITTKFNCPVYNLYGQTELHSLAISPNLGFKRNTYCQSVPNLGMKLKIVNSETGDELPNETLGRILIKTLIPPSMSFSFYKDYPRFIRSYFTQYPGFYDTNDQGIQMNDGSIQVVSRMDDVIRISGHRVSSGAVEEICLKNENLINIAVVSLEDYLNGNVPVAFAVKKSSTSSSNTEIIQQTVDLVNQYIGDFILFKKVIIVPCLPETKSGKISRFSLSAMINCKEFKIPTTIENPKSYKLIYDVLVEQGYKATLPIDY